MQTNDFSKADALRPVAPGSGASSAASTRRARAATTTSAETTHVQRAPPELTARVQNGARVPTPMPSDARSTAPVIAHNTDVVSARSAPTDVGMLVSIPTDRLNVRHGHSAVARPVRQVAPGPRPVREVMYASTRTGRSGAPSWDAFSPVFIQSAQLPSNYALTRTAVDKCEFKANAVPAWESRAAIANSITTRSLTHRWCSEFLLLRYHEGGTLKLVLPECIANGMRVVLVALHGDLGLWRDQLEANPGDAAAGAEVRARLAANDNVPQFVGLKDEGDLFLNARATIKTVFRVAHSSSKGLALLADVGAYLCVDGALLALRHDFVHSECTFRFTFVPNPLNDTHLPPPLHLTVRGAAIPPVAPSTASWVTPPMLGSIAHSPTDVYATATANGTSSVVAECDRQTQTRRSQKTVRFDQQRPSQALQPNRIMAAHGGAPATASNGIPPPLPPRDAGPVPAAPTTTNVIGANDPSSDMFSAVAMRDHKGRYLIYQRHGSHDKADGANHSNEDEVGDLGVLRLSNSRDKDDKRVAYFEMLMLPLRGQRAANCAADIDAIHERRTFTLKDLERAEPFKLAECSGRRVVFMCGEKYLAVRLPLTYNPDDAAQRTDQELYDKYFARGVNHEADGTLILVSQPSIAAVFTYSKAPDPLVFTLQSVALGTFVKFDYTPRALRGQAVDCVLGAIQYTRQVVLGRWRQTSDAPVRAHVGVRITDVRADKRRLDEGTPMTLVVKQPLGQALRDQAEETKLLKDRTKTRTMLATAAMTGAPLVGVAAGVANTVHGAGKQVATFVESAKSQSEGITVTVMDLSAANATAVAEVRAIDTAADATALQDTATPVGISVGPAATAPYADTGMQLATTNGTITGTAADYGCIGVPGQWLDDSTAHNYGSRIDFPDQWLALSTVYDAPRAPNDPTLAIPDAARINPDALAVCFPAQDFHVANATTDQVVAPDSALLAGFHAEIRAALHAQFDEAMTAQYQHILDPSAVGVNVDTLWDMGALDMHDGRHHANACAW